MEKNYIISLISGKSPCRLERLSETTKFYSEQSGIAGPKVKKGTVVIAQYVWKVKMQLPCSKEDFDAYYKSAIMNSINALFSLEGEKACDREKFYDGILRHVGIEAKRLRLVYADKVLTYKDDCETYTNRTSLIGTDANVSIL